MYLTYEYISLMVKIHNIGIFYNFKFILPVLEQLFLLIWSYIVLLSVWTTFEDQPTKNLFF